MFKFSMKLALLLKRAALSSCVLLPEPMNSPSGWNMLVYSKCSVELGLVPDSWSSSTSTWQQGFQECQLPGVSEGRITPLTQHPAQHTGISGKSYIPL